MRQQDYPKNLFEVIVADGMSEDKTAQTARSYGALVVENPDIRQGAGMNRALERARGFFVAFTADDCVTPAHWISTGVKSLLENPEFAAVGGPVPLPDSASDFEKSADLVFRLAGGIGYSVQSDVHAEREVDDIPGGNSMYRRETINKYLPFRVGLSEDVDMNTRMRVGGEKLLFVNEFYLWHYKTGSVIGYFRQIKRYATGRARLGKQLPQVIRPLHRITAYMPIAGLILFAALYSAQTLLALMAAVVIAIGFAYRSSRSVMTALLFPVAAALFLAGWSAGFIGESLRR